MTYFIQPYHSVDLGGCLHWVRDIERLHCLRGHKLPPVLPYSVNLGLYNSWRQREAMKEKICWNIHRERGKLGKVEPGSDFRHQKFNYSFWYRVFLIRATAGEGASPSSHWGRGGGVPQKGCQCGHVYFESPTDMVYSSAWQWVAGCDSWKSSYCSCFT